MNTTEIYIAYAECLKIFHDKEPKRHYFITAMGSMKFNGTWFECATYEDLDGTTSYTRTLKNFENFKPVQ